jgi:hypothetical protein
VRMEVSRRGLSFRPYSLCKSGRTEAIKMQWRVDVHGHGAKWLVGRVEQEVR